MTRVISPAARAALPDPAPGFIRNSIDFINKIIKLTT
jgi:hypothetical protein